jgi:hypothetical protein
MTTEPNEVPENALSNDSSNALLAIAHLSKLGMSQREVELYLGRQLTLQEEQDFQTGKLKGKYELHQRIEELSESGSQPALDAMRKIQQAQAITDKLHPKYTHSDYLQKLREELNLEKP